MSSSSHDPYHSFARGLRADLETASGLARTYRQIRQQRLQHTEAEISLARDRLQDALEGLNSDLDDIHQSVDVVSRVPKRFGLDEEEITQRRRFVQDCRRQIEELSQSISQSAKDPTFSDRATTSGRSYTSREDEMDHHSDPDDEDPNEAFEREHQSQLMHAQDSTLDRIGSTLTSLRDQAATMGHEIGEQLELVGALDTEVDSSQNRLSRAMAKMDDLVRRGDEKMGGWCVWILIVLLFLLLLVVLLV